MATTRILLVAAALALTGTAALAQQQQGRPAGRAPTKPAAEQPPAPPPIYPCRTVEEICHMGVVIGSQVTVLFTNAANAAGIEAKPIDVMGPDGAKLDLSKDAGRVVMLTGDYDPKVGLTKGVVVEVASPLASLALKAQLAGGGEEPPAKAPPRRR